MSDLAQVRRSNLRQGAVYMLVGLIWGMVIPATPFPVLPLEHTFNSRHTALRSTSSIKPER